MPISPENKIRYPANWDEIADRIFARAGRRKNKHGVVTSSARCEWCGVENAAIGYRNKAGKFIELSMMEAESRSLDGDRVIQIVLAVIHVHDRNPEACALDNLAAVCQQCHLRHDVRQHVASRIENQIAADVAAGQMLITDLLPKKEAS